jgi:hypothetical protein
MYPQKISAAFVKAQKEFSPALKCSTNPHFKSKYADLSCCVEAVIDALNNNGIALIQTTQKPQEGVHGIIVKTMFLHESGGTIECGELFIPSVKPDAQGYGSALTYARRYSLLAACGIAPEDDDGNESCKQPQEKPKVKTSNESKTTNASEQSDYAKILEAQYRLATSKEDLREYYKNFVKFLTKDQADYFIDLAKTISIEKGWDKA